MDKKILLGVIGEKLEIIQEQFSIIKEYDGKIPVIEIDLLMSNVRDLYELFITLQQENRGGITEAAPRQEPVKIAETPPPPVVEEVPDDIPEIPVSFRSPSILGFEPVVEEVPHPEEPQPAIPPVLEDEPEDIVLETITEPEPEPEPEPEFEPEPEPEPAYQPSAPQIETAEPPSHHNHEVHDTRPARTTFDLFSEGSHGTLADKFRDTQEKRVADRLSENKVADLRTTIGINDKFLFINELFDGNMRIYDEALKKLNDCNTMAQADLLLLDLKIVYNWDSESPTVKKFVELVRRKY